MAFEWHSAKAESNLKNHGVSFDEAATVFEDPFAEFLPYLRHSTNENRYLCLGFLRWPFVGRLIYRARR
jgi:uncharacterized DUF497 family protein